MDWKYLGKPYLKMSDDALYGFVYRITYNDGKMYIGKKNFYSTKELPELKTSKVREGFLRKRNKYVHRREDGSIITKKSEKKGVKAKIETYDVIKTEAKWQAYEGSSENCKGKVIAKKEILELCPTKASSTYIEAMQLFCNEAILSDNYINDNILGKFHRGHILWYLDFS